MNKERIESKQNVKSLLSIPDDVCLRIFRYLSPFELAQIQLLNKRLNNLSNQALWHSIYVYHRGNDFHTGMYWFNYTWMHLDAFLHFSRSRKLKKQFMKRLIFCNDSFMAVGWIEWLEKELRGCDITFSEVANLESILRMRSRNCDKLGLLYIPTSSNFSTDNIHLIRSLRIKSASQEFCETWLPQFTSLKSLHLEEPIYFRLKKKLRLTSLFLGNPEDNDDITSIITSVLGNVALSELRSLRLPKIDYWNEISQELFSIEEIQLDNEIAHLPYYSLREVHYLNDDSVNIDMDFLVHHPITYLSVNPGYNYSCQRFNAITTLKKVKLNQNEFIVVRSSRKVSYRPVSVNYPQIFS
ncbi:uncharacterized protein J8A68_001432 [[Candida] subhashii]|uniref:F-box domain-containing protein n=1 Tax=[Candida] subhashii TaxID=561895 RepID=A0A8J5QR12_9ASCO|nr:uncharacterized protein J8A68_001432 [[Candida] subhashii]KAG7665025.1 hypothetical protein J8A68_001432 [[Candida] subhashii]